MSIRSSSQALALLFGPEPVPSDFAVRGGGLLTLRPSAFISASTDLMASSGEAGQMPARFGDLTMPVGILFGADDRILDPAVHGKSLVAKVAGADFELIEGGGHMIPVTGADRTAAFIARIEHRAATAALLAKDAASMSAAP
jgi:pimeloyl-ACP methyl ester carboxylesterase